jgi:hypothetical protein
MEQTNVDRSLEALEEQHADDPERATMVRLSRRFKTTWIELGEALTRVKKDGSWKRWGHESFEVYAKNELKLRGDTVEKLTGSFMFLHKRAPEILKRDPIETTLPSMMAVDYLRRVEAKAEADTSIPKEAVEEVRHKILDEGQPMAKVARLYKDTLFPTTEHQKKESARKDIKKVATKLRDLLSETDAIPKRVSGAIEGALDELLSELNGEAKAA